MRLLFKIQEWTVSKQMMKMQHNFHLREKALQQENRELKKKNIELLLQLGALAAEIEDMNFKHQQRAKELIRLKLQMGDHNGQTQTVFQN